MTPATLNYLADYPSGSSAVDLARDLGIKPTVNGASVTLDVSEARAALARLREAAAALDAAHAAMPAGLRERFPVRVCVGGCAMERGEGSAG